MSKHQLKTHKIIERYREGDLSRYQAALKLGVSERTVTRKAKAMREQGLPALRHGNIGKKPANKYSDQIKCWYLDVYRKYYYDFNYSHAYERIIRDRHPSVVVAYDTFRRWLRFEGVGKTKKRRSSKARIARERHANEGLMVQLDGSPHKYNGKDEWTLISIIDDATSKVLASQLHKSETTFACMQVLRELIEKHGIPEFILTDQAGWSARTGKRAHFSQFERACKELDITIISTSVPESKGRVERSFRTSQDRLPPEIRLAGISDLEAANEYLKTTFIPDWNKRFAVKPKDSTTRFRPLRINVDLDNILTLKFIRQINKAHTISFHGKIYKLTNPPRNLWRLEATITLSERGKIKIFWDQMELEYSEVIKPERQWLMGA